MAITASHSATPELEKAVYATLKASTTFTSKSGGPYNPPRKGVHYPYITFGNHLEGPWRHFGNTGKQVLFFIHIWSQQLGTAEWGFEEAYEIQDTVTNILEAATFTLPNFVMVQNGFAFENSGKLLDPDGITRHLVSRFRAQMNAK